MRNKTQKKSTEKEICGRNNVINYSILTKLKLFKNYLASSGGIELHFASATSNIYIGRATVPIPQQMLKFIDKHQFEFSPKSRKFRTKTQIRNAQNRAVGEVIIDFDLYLCRSMNDCDAKEMNVDCIPNEMENDLNRMNTENKMSPTIVKKSSNKPKVKMHQNHDVKLQNEKSPTIVTNVVKSKKISSKNEVSTPFLDFLTGRQLSDNERNQAIQAMETTSPTESLIDLLSSDLDCLNMKEKRKSIPETRILNEIDSMRVHIYELVLTRAGVREILNENGLNQCAFSSGTFIVDITLDSIHSNGINSDPGTTFVSEVSRVFTTSSDCLPPRKYFNKQKIYSPEAPKINFIAGNLFFFFFPQLLISTNIPSKN